VYLMSISTLITENGISLVGM